MNDAIEGMTTTESNGGEATHHGPSRDAADDAERLGPALRPNRRRGQAEIGEASVRFDRTLVLAHGRGG